MKKLTKENLVALQGGAMEIVIIFEKTDAYCGIQRIYAEGELYSMRLVCD